MKTELKVGLAYLLGISGNVWAAIIVDLPPRIRDWVQHVFTALPIVFVLAYFYPLARPWLLTRLRDFQNTMAYVLVAMLLFTYAGMLRLKGRNPDEIASTITLFVLVMAFMLYLSRAKTTSAPSAAG